jgi:hypothetical protein
VWVLAGDDSGWLVRAADEAPLAPLLGRLPAPANNERSDLWCRQPLSTAGHAKLKQMVEVKAFEWWKDRERTGRAGTPIGDWVAAKTALGIPHCATV